MLAISRDGEGMEGTSTMKYAVIDTETSGLFDFSKPAEADGQPRLASLAIILLDDAFVETGRHDIFIKPDGWTMGTEAGSVNGLTNEILNERGIPILSALTVYNQILDQDRAIVAFNAQFDTKVMRGELRRAGLPDRFETTPNICVMRASTDIVKAPKKSGSGYKFPKLSEACAHFGIKIAEQHTAMGDAEAAAEVFRKLKALGACPDPEVHYATNRPIPIKVEDLPAPVASQTIGANNPPGPIDYARETMEAINKWMEDHPVILTEADAREAKLLVDRSKSSLAEIEAERDNKVRPLNEQVKQINTEYKSYHNPDPKTPDKSGIYDKIANELRARLEAFLIAEENKRKAAAREAERIAQAALGAAREAEAKEREAIENARVGEFGVNVAEVTREADTAFKAFTQAARVAEIAQVDTRFKVGGGFLKPTGLRTNKVLVLNDVKAAIDAIGMTEKIRDAVLSSARDYRKLRNELPKGVSEVEERVL